MTLERTWPVFALLALLTRARGGYFAVLPIPLYPASRARNSVLVAVRFRHSRVAEFRCSQADPFGHMQLAVTPAGTWRQEWSFKGISSNQRADISPALLQMTNQYSEPNLTDERSRPHVPLHWFRRASAPRPEAKCNVQHPFPGHPLRLSTPNLGKRTAHRTWPNSVACHQPPTTALRNPPAGSTWPHGMAHPAAACSHLKPLASPS